MNIDKATVGVFLKATSAVTCGLFAGGALYINIVEHPARMTHDATTAVTMWKPSFERAQSLQKKLAATSAVTAFCVHLVLKPKEYNWLVVGSTMLSIIPWTIFAIKPINDKLLDTETCISEGEDWIIEKLSRWNSVHGVRTLISVGTFTFIVFNMETDAIGNVNVKVQEQEDVPEL